MEMENIWKVSSFCLNKQWVKKSCTTYAQQERNEEGKHDLK